MAAPSSRPRWIWLGPLMLTLAVALVAAGIGGSLAAAPVEAWNGSRSAPPSVAEVVYGQMIGAGCCVALAALFLMLLQAVLWLVRKVGVGHKQRG